MNGQFKFEKWQEGRLEDDSAEDVRLEKEEEQAQTNNFVLTAKNQINKFCNVLNLSFTI